VPDGGPAAQEQVEAVSSLTLTREILVLIVGNPLEEVGYAPQIARLQIGEQADGPEKLYNLVYHLADPKKRPIIMNNIVAQDKGAEKRRRD
jgi:hypothetical protein